MNTLMTNGTHLNFAEISYFLAPKIVESVSSVHLI